MDTMTRQVLLRAMLLYIGIVVLAPIDVLYTYFSPSLRPNSVALLFPLFEPRRRLGAKIGIRYSSTPRRMH